MMQASIALVPPAPVGFFENPHNATAMPSTNCSPSDYRIETAYGAVL